MEGEYPEGDDGHVYLYEGRAFDDTSQSFLDVNVVHTEPAKKRRKITSSCYRRRYPNGEEDSDLKKTERIREGNDNTVLEVVRTGPEPTDVLIVDCNYIRGNSIRGSSYPTRLEIIRRSRVAESLGFRVATCHCVGTLSDDTRRRYTPKMGLDDIVVLLAGTAARPDADPDHATV
tara:strand:- start:179 stop:703 length:525 start_codon:yes stop_codon:yes gene_type:complete